MSEIRRDLLCKDCVHSYIPWHMLPLAYGEKKHLYYLCKKTIKKRSADERDNLVTGTENKKKEYEMCAIARMNSSECGTDAKHWSPKHKKDLFLVLTK